MLPSIFGTSLSFWLHVWLLRLRGFKVRVVDVYDGQEFGRPFFMKLVRSQEAIDAHAKRFRLSPVFVEIKRAIFRLQRAGCDDVFLVGYGLGGVFALLYEEKVAGQIAPYPPVDGVVAYYPHLAFPPGFGYDAPDPTKVRCPVRMFFVGDDRHVPAGTIVRAESAAATTSHVKLMIFHGANGHAFADFAVQYCFPNPLYRRRIARFAWQTMLRDMNLWSAARNAARSS